MPKSITIDFNANIAKYEAGIEKATNRLNRFGRNTKHQSSLMSRTFDKLGGKITAAFAGIAGIAGISALTKRSLDYADSIAKAAEKTGFTTTKIQELRFAAGQTGIGLTELEGGLARFTKRLGLARIGTGAAAGAYKKLGIDLSRTNAQVFRTVVDTLGSMNDATNRLALTTRFFGDDAQRLGVLFQNGNKGLKEFADQAHSLGLVLSEEMANNAAAANDQLTIMGKVVGIQATSVLVSLAPIITQVGQAFADAAPKVAAFFGQFGEVEGMTRGAATEAMQDASREYDRLAEKLQRRQLIDKDPSQSRQFSDLFLPSEEDIQERLDHYKKVFNSTILRLNELGKGTEVNVLDEAAKKATEAFNEMGAAASKASPETKKLFDTKAGNPLDSMASDAAKISKTFNLIGNALTIDGKGGDAKQSIEEAAAAINKLAKEGAVAEQTIKDMTASLNEARTGKESPELKLIATIEDTQAKAQIEWMTKPAEKTIYVTYVPTNSPDGGGSGDGGPSGGTGGDADAEGGRP